jgi:catechol 2,3-dioxygenase-like lactoylglutathione lyase family enzyme
MRQLAEVSVAPHAAREMSRPLTVEAIDHIVINVGDVEVSAAWYQRVLGMTREQFAREAQAPRTALKFGAQKINLRPVSASQRDWFTAALASAGTQELCLLTCTTPPGCHTHLQQSGMAIELGPPEKTGARGTLLSVYCRDPDGNLIEIASYQGVAADAAAQVHAEFCQLPGSADPAPGARDPRPRAASGVAEGTCGPSKRPPGGVMCPQHDRP